MTDASPLLHAVFWFFVYSLTLGTLGLAWLKAGRGPLRRFVGAFVYPVVTVSALYLSHALWPEWTQGPARWVQGLGSALTYHGLVLLAWRTVELARHAARRPPWPPRVNHLALSAGLGLTLVFGATNGAGTPWSEVLVLSTLALGLGLTVASFGGTALWLATRPEVGPGLKGAWGLAFGLFAVSVALEFIPQNYDPSLRGAFRPYFGLGLFFLAVEVPVLVALLRPAPVRPAEAEGASDGGWTIPADHWGLSPREAQVALGLARGQPYKEIAGDLGIALSTVQTHVARIYEKLGVGNKVELANRLRFGPPSPGYGTPKPGPLP